MELRCFILGRRVVSGEKSFYTSLINCWKKTEEEMFRKEVLEIERTSRFLLSSRNVKWDITRSNTFSEK